MIYWGIRTSFHDFSHCYFVFICFLRLSLSILLLNAVIISLNGFSSLITFCITGPKMHFWTTFFFKMKPTADDFVYLLGATFLNQNVPSSWWLSLWLNIYILRREGALNEMAVKPLTQFPVHIQEEVIEEKYSKFTGVRTITVRKVSSSSSHFSIYSPLPSSHPSVMFPSNYFPRFLRFSSQFLIQGYQIIF